MKPTYGQIVELADALRSVAASATGPLTWGEVYERLDIGFQTSAKTVREVAKQIGVRFDGGRKRQAPQPPAAPVPDTITSAEYQRLLRRVAEVITRMDAVAEVEKRTYAAIDGRLKKLETPKPLTSFGRN